MAGETTWHVPHDIVFKILLLLDIKPLMRFACVCKDWHSTITADRCFQREYNSPQKACVLIAPQRKGSGGRGVPLSITTPGLYRWEIQQGDSQATLVQAMDSFPDVEEPRRHTLSHCDGLVLVPTDGGLVRVLNPATRRVLKLPPSRRVVPSSFSNLTMNFNLALGLGHDPRSDTYKVARFFYRSRYSAHDYRYIPGLEVFTIGRDEHWRDIEVTPPYPVIAGQTATFFKGSLLWPIDESPSPGLVDGGGMPVRGFLRFDLEDESFGITPAPPGCPDLREHVSTLAVVRGELCFAHERRPNLGQYQHGQRPYSGSAVIWACSDADPPRWVRRHTVVVPLPIRMIAGFDDGSIMFQGRSQTIDCFDSQTTKGASSRVGGMHELIYHHPDTKKLVEYTKKEVHDYDVIPYVPSIVPI